MSVHGTFDNHLAVYADVLSVCQTFDNHCVSFGHMSVCQRTVGLSMEHLITVWLFMMMMCHLSVKHLITIWLCDIWPHVCLSVCPTFDTHLAMFPVHRTFLDNHTVGLASHATT